MTSGPLKFRLATKQPRPADSWGKYDRPGPCFAEDEIEDYLKTGRYMILNVWKSINDIPIKDAPLALLDNSTMSEDELVSVEYRYQDGTGVVGESYRTGYLFTTILSYV